MTTVVDKTDLAWWFPKIYGCGVSVPETTIIRAPSDFACLLDGEAPEGFDEFVEEVSAACDQHGLPAFLRTGHGSGKHEWRRTCFVDSLDDMAQRIFNLVEWSHLVDIMGLPHEVWAVREFIPADVLFVCEGWHDFPVTREFRLFVRDGEVEHVQPYWPPGAIEEGSRPDDVEWPSILRHASKLEDVEREYLDTQARLASGAIGGGYWSIDFLLASNGDWILTDMADGDRSFRWEPGA